VLCVCVDSGSEGCLLRDHVVRLGRVEECFGFIEPARLEVSETLLSSPPITLVYRLDHGTLADASVR